jgi:3-phenylpropionate/cinnamic acid dioxygenase small subunit
MDINALIDIDNGSIDPRDLRRRRDLFTNLMVEPTERQDEYNVRTNILVYRGRFQRKVDIFVGVRDDVFRRSPDTPHGWQIAKRRVILNQTVSLAKNLSTFF